MDPQLYLNNIHICFINITYNSDEEYNKVAIDIKERLEEYYNKDRIIIRNLIKEHIINNYSWESIFKQYKERILK